MVERTILEASLKKTRLPDVWTLHVRNAIGKSAHVVFPIPFSLEELEEIKTKLKADYGDEIADKLKEGTLRIELGNHALIAKDGTEIHIDNDTMHAGSTFAYREPAVPFENFEQEKQFRKVIPLKGSGSWATAHTESDKSIRDIVKRLNDFDFVFTSGWSHSLIEEKEEEKYKSTMERLEERRKEKKAGASNPWDHRLIHLPMAKFPLQQAYLTFRANAEDPKTEKLLKALKQTKVGIKEFPASQATFKNQPTYLIRFRAGHNDMTKRKEAVEAFWNKVRQALDESTL